MTEITLLYFTYDNSIYYCMLASARSTKKKHYTMHLSFFYSESRTCSAQVACMYSILGPRTISHSHGLTSSYFFSLVMHVIHLVLSFSRTIHSVLSLPRTIHPSIWHAVDFYVALVCQFHPYVVVEKIAFNFMLFTSRRK